MAKAIFVGIVFLTLAVFFGLVATFGAVSKKPAGQPSAGLQIGAGDNFQEVSIRATSAGTYEKNYLTVKKGVPVKLNFSADRNSGCGRALLMPAFGVDLLSRNGETVFATFLPEKEGKYEFHCSMKMFRGTLEVVP